MSAADLLYSESTARVQYSQWELSESSRARSAQWGGTSRVNGICGISGSAGSVESVESVAAVSSMDSVESAEPIRSVGSVRSLDQWIQQGQRTQWSP